MMNELDRYLFDLQGYVVLPNALDSTILERLNAILDEKVAEQNIPADAPHHRFPSILGWSPLFRSLIDNPLITPYLEELLGTNLRLDHDYLDIMRRGNGPTKAYLHGGGTPFDHSQFYRWDNGKMWSGLTVVGYNLRDVNPG
ncbi:MAG: mitomycin antibiotics/polyketide fumonisin biosynthesis protein, partial [Armatimonadetes bacterium]|nr:mitomycin antibiotics/polyketide fumonisin biosynthesis protein [Armatimonadota bacterium]